MHSGSGKGGYSVNRDSTKSIGQDLLTSLQGQENIAEVNSSGYLAGIRHDGVIVGSEGFSDGSNRRVVLEVSQSPVVTPADVREKLKRLSAITGTDADYRTVYLLLTSGDVTAGARELLQDSGVVIRSRRSFRDLCSDFWSTLASGYEDPGLTDRAKQLIDALSSVPVGRPNYSDYERVCCEILEYLFCPELGQPDAQSSTVNRSQRRDVVMDNHVEVGFWARIRDRYKADYLVAEMKNNAGAVSNTSVWQLAAYMKEKGVGLFGLLIARNGVSRGVANYAIIDQWVHSRKMVVPLSNEDLVRMIRLRDEEGEATRYLGGLIDRIRRAV